MAINFPSTAGQPTDGTFTYVAAGITYSWNGESWRAAGAGATATDRTIFSATNASASGGGSLSYSGATGVFTFTPPDLTPYMTSSNGGAGSGYDADLLDGQHGTYYTSATNLLTGTVPSGRLTGTYNIDISGTAATASAASFGIDGLNDVNITSASTNQVLTYNGSQWVNSTPGAVSGLQSRTTAQLTQSIGNNASANVSFSTPKTYALISIQTSHAAWVTLYTNTISRSNDASRTEFTDPTPGSGVLAEVITTGSALQLITPAAVCFNSTASNTTYAKIVNKSGATANITVTLTYVQLEA
jgi:hypothetical protein